MQENLHCKLTSHLHATASIDAGGQNSTVECTAHPGLNPFQPPAVWHDPAYPHRRRANKTAEWEKWPRWCRQVASERSQSSVFVTVNLLMQMSHSNVRGTDECFDQGLTRTSVRAWLNVCYRVPSYRTPTASFCTLAVQLVH
jgi:hypothetical protein